MSSKNDLIAIIVSNWMDILMSYSFRVEWIPGVLNTLPNLLSGLYETKISEEEETVKAAILLRNDSERKTLDLSKEEVKQLAINLVQKAHDQGSHYGIRDIVERIWNKGYTWNSMQTDIAKYISRCDTCVKYNLKK